MLMFYLSVFTIFLWFTYSLFCACKYPRRPIFHCKDLYFLKTILESAPILNYEYLPTILWGFSGHVQTVLYSIVGRVKCPCVIGSRKWLIMSDGATVTYDVFQPHIKLAEHDITLFVVPGICNNSESDYIRTFANYAQNHGYRCIVLNHIGTLSNVSLTAPRIFSFGHTDDLHEAICHVSVNYPKSLIIAYGYSMGGNIITKYMGETSKKKPPNLIAGISVCQPYDAVRATYWLLQWKNLRRLYQYALTESLKALIIKHRPILLSEDIQAEYNLCERDIISATTFTDLDDAYTRRVNSFNTLKKFYEWSSSIYYLKGIRTPMIFLNALDDPLVSDPLLQPIRDFASTRNDVIYIEMTHGGHLGFFEGGFLYPNPVSWLDRAMISLIPGLYNYNLKRIMRQQQSIDDDDVDDEVLITSKAATVVNLKNSVLNSISNHSIGNCI